MSAFLVLMSINFSLKVNKHRAMKAHGENITPRILILGTEWNKWSVVNPVRLICVTL